MTDIKIRRPDFLVWRRRAQGLDTFTWRTESWWGNACNRR